MAKPKQSKIIDELHPGFTERSDRNRRSQKRGSVFEREVANALKPLFPKARRAVGQTREGNEAPDVTGTPFWVECAKGSTNAIHDKLRQGLEASKTSPSEYENGKPVLVISHHGGTQETMATMRLTDFFDLLRLMRTNSGCSIDRLFETRPAPRSFLESVQAFPELPRCVGCGRREYHDMMCPVRNGVMAQKPQVKRRQR